MHTELITNSRIKTNASLGNAYCKQSIVAGSFIKRVKMMVRNQREVKHGDLKARAVAGLAATIKTFYIKGKK